MANPQIAALLVTAVILSLYFLYKRALPKPIPGIPYNPKSATRLLGDIPDLLGFLSQTDESPLKWVQNQVQQHQSPLIQLFIKPFGKPHLVLCDFRESQDILMRRKEFDRSPVMEQLFKGIAPYHHIHQKTNAVWKSNRRLLQDLMLPGFLHDVAGPVIHAKTSKLVELWDEKAALAKGRPFSVSDDMYHAALDAVLAFSFGEGFPFSAVRPQLDLVRGLTDDAAAKLQKDSNIDAPFVFPSATCDFAITIPLDIAATLERLQSSMMEQWRWWYEAKKSHLSFYFKAKDGYIREELVKAVQRHEEGGEKSKSVRSAVDHMVQREHRLAEKDGRMPDYLSPTMHDEVFGFLVAGHETTSTTLLWGVKLLADNPETQTRLRNTMQAAFPEAVAQNRSLTINEITKTHIPYLDATIEEILRCGGTLPAQDREAQCDTELLGHRIPKGTIVVMLNQGPSMRSPGFDIPESQRSPSSQAAKAQGRNLTWDPSDMAFFKPERWLTYTEEKGECDFDPLAGPQLSFGLGTRSCYGKRLAYLEMRILVSLIVWGFDLLRCPEELSGYEQIVGITHRPKQCFVRLRKVDLTTIS